MTRRAIPPLWYFLPILLLLCFVNKPFHIDDVLFLNIGKLLPWQVIGTHTGDISFLGVTYSQLSPYESTHPPLIPYLLKVITWLYDSDSAYAPFWVYHAFFLLFPFILLVECWYFSVANRLSALWGWLLVLSPPFFVNATNLMTDIAMLTFWLGSMFALIDYAASSKVKSLIKLWLYLLLACFTSYQSICLLPLLLAYALLVRGNLVKNAALILVPFGLFLLYLMAVYEQSGFFPFLSSTIDYNIRTEVLSGFSLEKFIQKLLAACSFMGLGLMMFMLSCILFLRHRFVKSGLALMLSFLLCCLGRFGGNAEISSTAEFIAIFILVFFAMRAIVFISCRLLEAVKKYRAQRVSSAFDFMWILLFFGVLTYNILFLPFSTARYILPALPGVLVLLYKYVQIQRLKEVIAIAATVAMSCLMAMVDFRQASCDWDLFHEVKNEVDVMSHLYYSDDAGLSMYLKSEGAHYLTRDTRELPSDRYVLITRGLVNAELQSVLEPVATYRFPCFLGLSLFNRDAKAGFYQSNEGLLPAGFAKQCQSATLYKVNDFLKRFGDSEPINLSNPNYVGIRSFCDDKGDLRRGIFMHPDAEISYPVPAPGENTCVTGTVYMPKSSWEDTGDGVTFHIGEKKGHHVSWLWKKYLDPRNNEEDRAGHSFSLPLSRDCQAIHLKVTPGPAQDYRHDSAFWFSLELKKRPK